MVSRETLLAEYFPTNREKAIAFEQILATKGIQWGLLGPKEGDRIWDRHIANCLPLTTLIPEGATVIDIGSGAGLPGFVIALARPDLKVTLLEPLERRFNFLQEVAKELEIPVTIHRGKAENERGTFQVVTGRAVAPLSKFVKLTWHLLAPNGSILAIKGAAAADEIATLKSESRLALRVALHEIPMGELGPSRIVEVVRAG